MEMGVSHTYNDPQEKFYSFVLSWDTYTTVTIKNYTTTLLYYFLTRKSIILLLRFIPGWKAQEQRWKQCGV